MCKILQDSKMLGVLSKTIASRFCILFNISIASLIFLSLNIQWSNPVELCVGFQTERKLPQNIKIHIYGMVNNGIVSYEHAY